MKKGDLVFFEMGETGAHQFYNNDVVKAGPNPGGMNPAADACTAVQSDKLLTRIAGRPAPLRNRDAIIGIFR
jgi:uncharacterized cupin superfamily protein